MKKIKKNIHRVVVVDLAAVYPYDCNRHLPNNVVTDEAFPF
ncbi:MAG: hypothetical protein AAF985_23450 [Bacteroidota bacterium]